MNGGRDIAAIARELGMSEQTLRNWVKAAKEGKLTGSAGKAITPEQMELSRLRAEVVRLKRENEMLKNRPTRLPVPLMNRNSGRVHWMRAETVAVSFLEA